jgi:GSH-dependent disulfide-bond oxidoreductase
MIHLYTWTTPNGVKPLIMLEELGLPYETHWVNIGNGEQHEPAYERINPNGKIPALADGETTIFESGAVLVHLAEKTGRFLAPSGPARSLALGWLFFQVGGVGPMFGQLGHFLGAKEKNPYAIERYRNETLRLYGVLDRRLGEAEYLAGEYGIADMATYGWARAYDRFGIDPSSIPHVQAWVERVGARPAVQRATAFKPG